MGQTPDDKELITGSNVTDVTAVGEFRREAIPLLSSGTAHPLEVEAALKRGMQEGQHTRSSYCLPG